MACLPQPLVLITVLLQLHGTAASGGMFTQLKQPAQVFPRFAGPAFLPGYRRPATTMANAYKTEVVGEAGTASYRLKFSDESGKAISPWHDIPLSAGDGAFNALFEIPKMTKPKMEVATKEEGNPIAQDEKKGKLRDYHGPIFWNYGMLPQTWEDPNVEDPKLKCNGDNDPVDVVEIGSKVMEQGTVAAVKPLGALAMIDDGELDWKVIAISVDDPDAAKYNDIGDVPDSIISGIREWFRWYKTPDGKPLNAFGYDEKALDKAATLKIIDETHGAWKKLMAGECDAGKLWKPAELSAEAPIDAVGLFSVFLISFFVGSGGTFAVYLLKFRRRASDSEYILLQA
jgi:inorganic pyrophosphatase